MLSGMRVEAGLFAHPGAHLGFRIGGVCEFWWIGAGINVS